MRSVPRSLALLALLAASALLAPAPAPAAWIPFGNPVCTAAGDQEGGNTTPDGSGGVFVTWLDHRRGPTFTDLYCTRLLGDGSIAPGWPANGLALAQAGGAGAPSPMPDGAGGLMLFWFDRSTYQARMQHVDGAGVRAPGFPADGLILPISVGGPSGYIVQAVPDAAGGAFVLWNSFTGVYDALRVTCFTASGALAPGWNASGVIQLGSDSFNPSIGFSAILFRSDGVGGTLTAAQWNVEDFPSGGHVVGAIKRMLASGAGGFYGAMTAPSAGTPMSLEPDGSGGAFLAWRSSADPSRRMQHFLSNGTAAWPTPTAAPASNRMIGDGSGGIFVFGQPPGLDHIAIYRRDGNAATAPPWPEAGLELSSAGSYWAQAAVLSGNRVYASWSSGFFYGENDLRAAAVTTDGALASGWQPEGTLVCGGTGVQLLTALLPMPPDAALVTWSDTRSGNSDVYVTLLQPDGPVFLDVPPPSRTGALAFAAHSPFPNPARGRVRFSFALADARSASLEIVDVTGRVRARLEPESRTGAQSLDFDASALPAGLYWACLRQGTERAVTRLAVVH